MLAFFFGDGDLKDIQGTLLSDTIRCNRTEHWCTPSTRSPLEHRNNSLQKYIELGRSNNHIPTYLISPLF